MWGSGYQGSRLREASRELRESEDCWLILTADLIGLKDSWKISKIPFCMYWDVSEGVSRDDWNVGQRIEALNMSGIIQYSRGPMEQKQEEETS